MKIKSDYVTNSSSCTFILSGPKKDNDNDAAKIKLEVEIDLINFIRMKIKCEEDYQTFLDEWGYRGAEDEDRPQKIKAALDKGEIVYILDVSDEGSDPIEQLLCHKGIVGDHVRVVEEGITILEGRGGY